MNHQIATGGYLVTPCHGKPHVVLVPTFGFPSYCLDLSSAKTFAGKGTLKTSAMFPPQPTISLPQSVGLHHFHHHRLQHRQPSLPPPNLPISCCPIAPLPPFSARSTNQAGNHLPPVALWSPDPRDFHSRYPSTFDTMVSTGNKHDSGPRPSPKAGIPAAPAKDRPTTKKKTITTIHSFPFPVMICTLRSTHQGGPKANLYNPGGPTLQGKGCYKGTA
jgi:hypothetical protein